MGASRGASPFTYPGRHHPGTVGGIISEWWAASPGIRTDTSTSTATAPSNSSSSTTTSSESTASPAT